MIPICHFIQFFSADIFKVSERVFPDILKTVLRLLGNTVLGRLCGFLDMQNVTFNELCVKIVG